MVYALAVMAFLIITLFILLIDLFQRLGQLKSRCASDKEYANNCFNQQITRFITNENSIEELNRVSFIMVDSPSSRNFQERVSIGTILGAVMSELGLNMKYSALKITKKGDQNYGKRKETKRGQTEKEKS